MKRVCIGCGKLCDELLVDLKCLECIDRDKAIAHMSNGKREENKEPTDASSKVSYQE